VRSLVLSTDQSSVKTASEMTSKTVSRRGIVKLCSFAHRRTIPHAQFKDWTLLCIADLRVRYLLRRYIHCFTAVAVAAFVMQCRLRYFCDDYNSLLGHGRFAISWRKMGGGSRRQRWRWWRVVLGICSTRCMERQGLSEVKSSLVSVAARSRNMTRGKVTPSNWRTQTQIIERHPIVGLTTPRAIALHTIICEFTAHRRCSLRIQSCSWTATMREFGPFLFAKSMRWVNVRCLAAYRQTQRSSLKPGLRVGGHLALTDFRPDDPKVNWRRRW